MTAIEDHELATTIRVEMTAMFGPPPVLSTERLEAFDAILLGLISSHKPWDFMSKQFVWWMAVASWDIARYGRHKKLGIERKYRRRLEFQVQRAKSVLANRKATSNNQTAEEEISPEFQRLLDLMDVVETTLPDLNEIAKQAANELDHSRALEEGIRYHEQLDNQLNAAIRRFHIAFAQFQQYRADVGWLNAQMAESLGGDIAKIEQKSPDQPSIVPSVEGPSQ